MDIPGSIPERPPPSIWRRHDGDGVSDLAHAVIVDHGLNMGRIMYLAGLYALRRGVDFNAAPNSGLANAPLWKDLRAAAGGQLVPAAEAARFAGAMSAKDYLASDAMMSSWLKGAVIVDRNGRSLYGEWRYWAEHLEGFNVALFWAAKKAALLYRLVGNVDELGNYQSGRWRQAGDLLDRVSLTAGMSNPSLDSDAEALVAYDARLLAGCIQPVRYSPYPRLDEGGREGFGSEKYASYAGECEVHLYAGCRTLPKDRVDILPRGDAKRRRAEIIAKYGEAGIFY